jgi:hypothetical protein
MPNWKTARSPGCFVIVHEDERRWRVFHKRIEKITVSSDQREALLAVTAGNEEPLV